ncbi:uncharacterized protein Z518_08834 [Rhinocladiella mackenziei CBS 650.93]|uniref:Sec20 C-terminal domain-containing protein n=1 Tax=Rhinocladiella mackenziei CBS 650.93 TaxID=1442369 RepID=A0A0D2IHW9_9EURO|nr:uncharacterized protein Z518_08834 [Rhinocladiella mackenziei CBS 650.93]KIX02891.1 hypothetical protein Z518_08834 [Rhinocladiella mackenziei CBS 650.93]
MSFSLTQRLQALADSYKETLNLIQELRKFSPASYPDGDRAERRLELATEIHDRLKEQEDTLDILRQELEDESAPSSRRDRPSSPGDSERERNADLVARLTEDLKSARSNFRRAQLQSKRNADNEKRKEREQLFAERKDSGQPRGRATHEKLTQDELALRAADDVTMALRRVHNQLEGELSRSQFAQQTLEESQQALESLSQSYVGTTDLLKSSRGFVSQLVRSNKSDTWFLRSSFYILAATICWLFYRRILFGPMMLFIWWPLRMIWWFATTSLGAMGLGRVELASSPAPIPSLSVSVPGVNAKGMPTHNPNMKFKSMELPAKGGGWERPPAHVQQPTPEESVVETISRMIEDHGTNMDDLSGEERKTQQEQPRNSKKRMMEVEIETPGVSRDEL